MRRLLVTMAVVGLVALSVVADSYALRVPARDVAIPVWLGDPDNGEYSKPADRIKQMEFGECESKGESASLQIGLSIMRIEIGNTLPIHTEGGAQHGWTNRNSRVKEP